MININKLIVAVFLVIVSSCSSTYEAEVAFDKNSKVDTEQYYTFAWLTSEKIMVASKSVNPVMKLRIDEEIEGAFIAKGYKLIDNAENADFAISYTVGSREKIKVSSYPATYNSGFGWGRGYYGGYYGGMYGNMYGTSMGTETRVRQYTEGKLAIDVYDVKSHQPAWHGWAVKHITSADKETPLVVIKSVVYQLIAQFN